MDRLREFGAKGDELLICMGLSYRIHQKPIRAAGNIIDDPFSPAINSAPSGWTRASSSSGLDYFRMDRPPYGTTWLWSFPQDQQHRSDHSHASEPREPISNGKPSLSTAASIEIDGDVMCCSLYNRACADSGAHQRSLAHGNAVQQWRLLVDALERCRGMPRKATQLSCVEHVGLVHVWRGELCCCIEDVKSGSEFPSSSLVEAICWHRAVVPLLPSTISTNNSDAAFGVMLERAKLPAPSPQNVCQHREWASHTIHKHVRSLLQSPLISRKKR